MLKKKPAITRHKKDAETQLAKRVETLQTMGMNATQIQRDAMVKHFKGKIRQADKQLAGIVNLERVNLEKAEAKAARRTARNAVQPKKKQPLDPAKKKARLERKMALAGEAEA